MKIKYVGIKSQNISKINIDSFIQEHPLVIDKEYIVYAINYISDSEINFYIMNDSGYLYPEFYSSQYFEIADRRISKYWDLNDKYYPIKIEKCPQLVSFKEWRKNEYFHGDMFENENNAIAIFQKYKMLMDHEFPDEKLNSALLIDKYWVMCSNCNETWEVNPLFGIVTCPKCNKKANNPLYMI